MRRNVSLGFGVADPLIDLPMELGKYRLLQHIATGGMADIFLAEDTKEQGRRLVIKKILPSLTKNRDFISMFLDEARIAAQLAHENIVRIYDVGQIDGEYFIAMEYIHGEDIRRIYNQAYRLKRSLPLSHSIRAVAEAARGLSYAHSLCDFSGAPLGVVHRDISPQNIIISYTGAAKIVDFGIAKAANKVAQTRAGVLKGKYSYMSPEQALGETIDYRTDIFALGIILYETTTGARLFKKHNELATLQAIMKCEFVLPSDVLEGYPPRLEKILLRAIEKDPQDRYQDAAEFSDELFVFLKDSDLYVERSELAAFLRDLFKAENKAEKLQVPKEKVHGAGDDPVVALEETVTKRSAQPTRKPTLPMRDRNPTVSEQEETRSDELDEAPTIPAHPVFEDESSPASGREPVIVRLKDSDAGAKTRSLQKKQKPSKPVRPVSKRELSVLVLLSFFALLVGFLAGRLTG